jgi:hypothetical protein
MHDFDEIPSTHFALFFCLRGNISSRAEWEFNWHDPSWHTQGIPNIFNLCVILVGRISFTPSSSACRIQRHISKLEKDAASESGFMGPNDGMTE